MEKVAVKCHISAFFQIVELFVSRNVSMQSLKGADSIRVGRGGESDYGLSGPTSSSPMRISWIAKVSGLCTIQELETDDKLI